MTTPFHPGKYLTDILYDNQIYQHDLAAAIHCSRQQINNICGYRRDLTPDMAYRLGIALGTGTQYWLDLQNNWDIHKCENNPRCKDVQVLIKPK